MAVHAHITPAAIIRRLLAGKGRSRDEAAARHPGRRSVLFLFATGAATTALAAATSPPVAAAKQSSTSPAALAAWKAMPTDEWQLAQHAAAKLTADARRARRQLEARIGPRGLVLGSLTLPSGRVVPIRAASTDSAKRLWRRLQLGLEFEPERASVLAAVSTACSVWDAHAEQAGVQELERQAEGARSRGAILTGKRVQALAEQSG